MGFSSLFLTSCAPAPVPRTGSGSLREFIHGMSGVVIEAGKQAAATVELTKMGVKKGTEVLEDVKRRAGDIQEGVQKITEGKDLIESGVTGSTETLLR